MANTKVYQGYGVPTFMEGGMAPVPGGDPSMGGGMEMPAEAPMDPMSQLQPMVEGYVSNPDPALAEEIIMTLASLMGIAPQAAPSPPAGAEGGMPMGGDPAAMGGGMPMPGFEKGGKLNKILTSIQLK